MEQNKVIDISSDVAHPVETSKIMASPFIGNKKIRTP